MSTKEIFKEALTMKSKNAVSLVEDAIADFVTAFDQMFGSAAEVWMDYNKKLKLFDLAADGKVFKVVDTESKKKNALKTGWKLFAEEVNFENYDAILYKY